MELYGKKPTVFVSIPKGQLEFKVTLEYDEVNGFHFVSHGTYDPSSALLLDEEWGWFHEMENAWDRWFELVGRRILDGLNADGRAARYHAARSLRPRLANR